MAQYRLKDTVFGLSNAAAKFQHEINKALPEYQHFASRYIDDVALLSETFNRHLLHLETRSSTLSQFNHYQYSINLKKLHSLNFR